MNGVPALQQNYPRYGNVLAQGAGIKGQESRNALTEMQLRNYPEDRNYLRKKRAQDMKRGDIDYETKVLEIGTTYLKRVEDIADYGLFRQFMIKKFGVMPEILPPPESFGGNEEAFDQFRNRSTLSAQERILLNKSKLGEKITISKILNDGRVRKTEVYAKDFLEHPEKYPGFEQGEITGTRTPKEKATGKLYETTEGYLTADKAVGKKKPAPVDKPPPPYTVQQKIDDARQFYSLKMRSLLDSFGDIKEGNEKEYDALMDKLARDENTILAGGEPSYRKDVKGVQQRKPGETIADYMKRTK